MTSNPDPFFIEKNELQTLIDVLRRSEYCVVGPTLDQEAIVYNELHSTDQLPIGWTDEQSPGHYRLKHRDDDAWFGFVVGPHSWKKYLFPPKATLLSAEKVNNVWTFTPIAEKVTKYAFLGVRACELAAIQNQDRIFLDGPYQDPIYRERRERTFLIAVNCTQAASTCFCTSMKTGPQCERGFDLALTELHEGFVCEVASDLGGKILAQCSTTIANAEQLHLAQEARQRAVNQIERRMDTSDLPGLLVANLEHPRWKSVGERCLSCTNCTMVCPTCFCSSVTEIRDLNMERIERERTWDSCFNPDFSYLGGSLVRNDTASRYRQWLTHKLDSWHDQYSSSGCVGCGRCIVWCPVGIDLTEEVAAIREVISP